jgi:hypothetical protein
VKVNVPVDEATVVGEKVTPTVQLAPAAMLVPQVLLATGNGALVAMPMLLSTVVCLFVNVTVLAALVLPATVVLKLRLETERVTGALPVPDRLTF